MTVSKPVRIISWQRELVGGVLLILTLIALVGLITGSMTMLAFGLAIVPVSLGLGAHAAWRDRKSMSRRLKDALADKEQALVAIYLKSRRRDEFGDIDESLWEQKVDVFLQRYVIGKMDDFASWRASPAGKAVGDRVTRAVLDAVKQYREDYPFRVMQAEKVDPVMYEALCAAELEAHGWKTGLTRASADSGADIIAVRKHCRLIVQCKRYRRPVGNKAVQEVYAANALYNGTHACVVAPCGFTRPAQREAEGLGISLLSHGQLGDYADRIAAEAVSARQAVNSVAPTSLSRKPSVSADQGQLPLFE